MLPYSEAFMRKAVLQCIPVQIALTLTERCNERCRHCYLPRTASSPGLPTARLLSLFEELAQAGCVGLTMTGGEPLLRSDLLELLKAARTQRFAIGLFTNATLIDEEWAEALAGVGLQGAEVSLYGATAEAHDAITQRRGSFARTMAGMRRLTERGVNVVLKFVVTRLNVGHLEQLPALAASMNCDWEASFLITPRLDGDTSPMDLIAPQPETPDPYRVRNTIHLSDARQRQRDLGCPCGAARGEASVNARGDVLPCVMWPDTWSLGNVLTHSFEDIWHGPRAEQFRELTGQRNGLQCAACEDEPWCGRCPAVSTLVNGDMWAPYPMACEHARRTRRMSSRQQKTRRLPLIRPGKGGQRR